jgi:hypothetical protein
MSFTGWKYYKNLTGETIGIISADGKQSRSLQDLEVAKWIEEGNTPEEAE